MKAQVAAAHVQHLKKRAAKRLRLQRPPFVFRVGDLVTVKVRMLGSKAKKWKKALPHRVVGRVVESLHGNKYRIR